MEEKRNFMKTITIFAIYFSNVEAVVPFSDYQCEENCAPAEC